MRSSSARSRAAKLDGDAAIGYGWTQTAAARASSVSDRQREGESGVRGGLPPTSGPRKLPQPDAGRESAAAGCVLQVLPGRRRFYHCAADSPVTARWTLEPRKESTSTKGRLRSPKP